MMNREEYVDFAATLVLSSRGGMCGVLNARMRAAEKHQRPEQLRQAGWVQSGPYWVNPRTGRLRSFAMACCIESLRGTFQADARARRRAEKAMAAGAALKRRPRGRPPRMERMAA